MLRTCCVIILLGFSPNVFAALSGCSLSTTSVNFGNYDVFSTTDDDTTGTITWSCSSGAGSIVFSLNKGLNSSVFNPRVMKSGTNTQNYQLYTNSGRTTIWGDGTSSTSTSSGSGRNGTKTVYGRIVAGQDISVGTYTDTVVVTASF